MESVCEYCANIPLTMVRRRDGAHVHIETQFSGLAPACSANGMRALKRDPFRGPRERSEWRQSI